MPERRRTFLPVLGLGVAAGIIAAVAGARAWVRVAQPEGRAEAWVSIVPQEAEMALAATLSLVVLAAWGVVLVTRRVVRRAAAVLGLVASLGLCVVVYVGGTRLPESLVESLREAGAGPGIGTELTPWFWVAAVAALVSLVTTGLAVAWCPAWPEMGSRYDAPGSAGPHPVPVEEQSHLDLWKQQDEGRDPTA